MGKPRKINDISIPVPWGVIAGRTIGEERNIPVLCVHGRNDNLETFSQLLPLLPDHHYYVCIDLPGHGKSSHADKGYILDLTWYIMTIKRVVDYFNWSKLYYIGHSLGGQIGFLLSALYPELVVKLVIIDSFISSYLPSVKLITFVRDDLFESTLKLEKRSSLDEAPTYSFDEFLKKMKEARMTEVSDDQIKKVAERNLIKVGPDQFKFSNDQRNKVVKILFTSKQYENIVNAICCPTLEIFGRNSEVTKPLKEFNKSLLQKNTNIKMQVIDGDHDIHLARADQVARLVVPFLSGEVARKTFGEESSIPVLCVHGGSDNLETFAHLLPLLPMKYYYVCIDLPGHGKSSHAEKGYILDLVWHTLAVKRVINYFSWPKLYYLGHSFGGQIGFLLSSIYPELMLKLVIIDTLMDHHVCAKTTTRATRQYLLDTILKLEKRSRLDEAPTYSFANFVQKMKTTRMTEVSDYQIKAMAERNLIKIGPDQFKFSNDQRNKLFGVIFFTKKQLECIARQISCPTLVILGKNSFATRPLEKLNCSPMQKSCNIVFQVIEGDHDVHLAHPEAVARLIIPFLSGETVSKL